MHQLLSPLSVEPGLLCQSILPILQTLTESLNRTSLTDAIFQAVIGDPSTYNIKSNWYSILFVLL